MRHYFFLRRTHACGQQAWRRSVTSFAVRSRRPTCRHRTPTQDRHGSLTREIASGFYRRRGEAACGALDGVLSAQH